MINGDLEDFLNSDWKDRGEWGDIEESEWRERQHRIHVVKAFMPYIIAYEQLCTDENTNNADFIESEIS